MRDSPFHIPSPFFLSTHSNNILCFPCVNPCFCLKLSRANVSGLFSCLLVLSLLFCAILPVDSAILCGIWFRWSDPPLSSLKCHNSPSTYYIQLFCFLGVNRSSYCAFWKGFSSTSSLFLTFSSSHVLLLPSFSPICHCSLQINWVKRIWVATFVCCKFAVSSFLAVTRFFSLLCTFLAVWVLSKGTCVHATTNPDTR